MGLLTLTSQLSCVILIASISTPSCVVLLLLLRRQYKRPLRPTATASPTAANPIRNPAAWPKKIHGELPPSLQHSPSVGYSFQGTPSARAHKIVRGIYRATKEANRRKAKKQISVASTPRKTTLGGSLCKIRQLQQQVEHPTTNPMGHPTRVHIHIPMAAMEEIKGADNDQVMSMMLSMLPSERESAVETSSSFIAELSVENSHFG